MIPHWLASTLSVLPALILLYGGIGIPLALLALPRKDWRDRPLVVMCAIGFSAAFMTAYMLILGILGQNTNITAGDPLNPMQSQMNQLVGGQALLNSADLNRNLIFWMIFLWLWLIFKIQRTPRPEATSRVPLAS
ncbi:MAG: hypothetical protein MUE54_07685, partial [Anaerolineae bacterium]|nr:hypothetical protein [Anaerolineae bacterium]